VVLFFVRLSPPIFPRSSLSCLRYSFRVSSLSCSLPCSRWARILGPSSFGGRCRTSFPFFLLAFLLTSFFSSRSIPRVSFFPRFPTTWGLPLLGPSLWILCHFFHLAATLRPSLHFFEGSGVKDFPFRTSTFSAMGYSVA